MRLRRWITAAAAAVLGGLLVSGGTATATFPGANGRILFLRDGDIYTMTSSGRAVRRLTATRGADEFFAAWSPDGRLIAYSRFREGSPAQLWIMNADGSGQHPLLRSAGAANVAPRFSPDGTTIVLGRCPNGPCSLWRIGVDGSGLAPITPFSHTTFDMHPSLSPSGTQLAFWSQRRQGVRKPALYVGNPDATALRRITPGRLEACCPDWAPDGSRLAFHSHGCDPDCPRHAEIWTVGADGAGLTRLTRPGRLHDFDPSWSPDGTAIAFERRSADERRQSVYVIDPGGGRPRLLQRNARQPRWGPATK